MYFYKAYELRIESELPVPSFPECESGLPDIQIRTVPFTDDETTPLWEVPDRSTCRLKGPPGVAYEVRQGREILVRCSNDMKSDAALFLKGTPLAVALMQRGFVLFHGAAVKSENGAILVLGEVSSGKSVLATGLMRAGLPLLSDTSVAIRLNGDSVELVPSVPLLTLWAESLREMGRNSKILAPVRADLQKFDRKAMSWSAIPIPICSVFITTLRLSLVLQQLSTVELEADLNAHLYRELIAKQTLGSEQVRAVIERIASHASGHRVTVPNDWRQLDSSVEAILKQTTAKVTRDPQQRIENFGFIRESRVTPAFPGKPGWIVLASFPKSGNTWMRALLTAWRAQTDESPNIATLDCSGEVRSRHFFDEISGIQSDLLYLEEIERLRPQIHLLAGRRLNGLTLLKTHDALRTEPGLPLLFPPESIAAVIYVVRNPLDVVGSYADHYGIDHERAVHLIKTGVKAPRTLEAGYHPFIPFTQVGWAAHTSSWIDQNDLPVLVVRYEDLLSDGVRQLKRVIDHLGIAWNPDLAPTVVEKCHFKALQHQERQSGFIERMDGAAAFFRIGRSGTWRANLPQRLAEEICDAFAPTMESLGYGAELKEVLGH